VIKTVNNHSNLKLT